MFFLKYFPIFQLFLLAGCAPGDVHEVTIYNGKVSGLEQQTENNVTFYTFLGIPFAKPPLGNLRFRAPLPASNWTGTYNATYERSFCLTTALYILDITAVGDEDCLYINVYTPQDPANISSSMSVIVWIYGGAFFMGNGNIGPHGADRFMDAGGVVFVSFQYRLGIIGFLSTEDESAPGNYGLKDQILALQWVQENIAVFGGNPNDVTLMGESAGAASVHYIIQCHRAAGLFHKAIAESGNSLNPWSQSTNARFLAFEIGIVTGILTSNSTTLVEGLRTVPAANLIQNSTYVALKQLMNPLNALPYAPVIEKPSPEAVITSYSYEQLLSGDFNHVPLLNGFNSFEWRDYSQLPWYEMENNQYNLCACNLCPDDMHATGEGRDKCGDAIKRFYFGSKPVINDTVRYMSDNAFVRGIVKISQIMSKYVPVYLYRFNFAGGIVHNNFIPEGVSHAEEVQFLFLSNSTIQVTPEAKLTVVRMIEMWTNFARTGNPTPKLTEAVNAIWPIVNKTGFKDIYYLNIDTNLTVETNPEKAVIDFWNSLFRKYWRPPYNLY